MVEPRACRVDGDSGVSSDDVRAWLDRDPRTARFGLHRGLGRTYAGAEHLSTIGIFATARDAGSEVRVSLDEGGLAAAVVVSLKSMETESFGVPTFGVSHIASGLDGERRSDAARSLLTDVLASRPRGQLLSFRVDSDDIETFVAAQQCGFGVVEATVAWYGDGDTADAGPASHVDGVTVDIHEGDVAGVLSDEEVALLSRSTSSWELNRFRAEPRLSARSVDDFYRRWLPNIASGEWCDCLFVARFDGRLVGILNEVTDWPLLAATGVHLRICEWLVSTEPNLKLGCSLLATAGRSRASGARLHQWETQLRNLSTMRSIEGTGVAVPVRTSYTLHAWS